MSTASIPNILIWLIVVIIILVILFWLLDRFLVMSGGIVTVNNLELPMISLGLTR